MATSIIQRSLAGGELTPAVYARTDLAKYQVGAKLMRNMLVLRHGGSSNRAGTELCAEVKDSTKRTRVFRFKFNTTTNNAYALELGHLYMRVFVLGAQVQSTTVAWSGVATYNVMDQVSNLGINYYCQLAVTVPGTAPASDPTHWYAMPGTIYEIPAPFTESELFQLSKVQSGDVITWAHPDHDPVELQRFDVNMWKWAVVSFVPDTLRPTALAVASGGAGALTFDYKVSAVNADTLEQSLPAVQAAKVITGITQANPGVVTSVAHGYVNGDEIFHEAIVGMTQLNDRTIVAAGVTANTYQLQGVDTTTYDAYVSGGTAKRIHAKITAAAAGTVGAPHVVSWTAPAGGVLEYDVFRAVNGRYGYIGTSSITTFNDTGITPDLNDTPPSERNPFLGDDDKPSAVTYIQQRLVFANTRNDPYKVFMSRSASFHNFTFRSPQQADDAITFPVVGKEISPIRHLLEIDKFVVMTESGEFTIDGNDAGIVLPNAINPHQRGYTGASAIEPLFIGGSALYGQARGSVVRDYKYDIRVNGFNGKDLTVFAAHLFDNNSLVSWDYQQIPHSIVWAIRNDGKLLGLTYLEEHEVWGWHQHDTLGLFEDVASVPEEGNYGNEDFVYFVVNRTINSQQKRFIERMHSRKLKADNLLDDAWFVDCGLEYDGRNYGATTMVLALLTGWTVDDVIQLDSSVAYFIPADVGNSIVLFYVTYDPEDTHQLSPIINEIRTDIISYISNTRVQVRTLTDVPVDLQAVATVNWAKAVNNFTGLLHLAGERVAVYGEGNTVHNGFDDDAPIVVSLTGDIDLEENYYLVRAGLPFKSQLRTLDIDVVDGETIRDKQKLVGKVSIIYQDSRGTFVGEDEDHLIELKQRDESDDYNSIFPLTGIEEIDIDHTWNATGSVLIEQRDPLPITVLAVIPAVTIGG